MAAAGIQTPVGSKSLVESFLSRFPFYLVPFDATSSTLRGFARFDKNTPFACVDKSRGNQKIPFPCNLAQLDIRTRSSLRTCKASMAAYGGHEAVAELGNQIFVTMRRGNSWPPAACDVRVRYDQTVGDLKAAVEAKMGIPVSQQQSFWHKQELTAAYDSKTLLDMNMHTGFALKGYDLSQEPDYWPPVQQTADGLREQDS